MYLKKLKAFPIKNKKKNLEVNIKLQVFTIYNNIGTYIINITYNIQVLLIIAYLTTINNML